MLFAEYFMMSLDKLSTLWGIKTNGVYGSVRGEPVEP